MAEPISVQQLKDASLDVKSLEEVVNGDENVVVTTRLGETYPSVKSVIDNLISQSGFIIIDSFELGATLTQRNQALRHTADGKLYRWAGDLPKTVAASSTPENSGGFGSNAWVEVSDASLAQKLAGLGGASTIGSGVSVFNNMAEFLVAESQIKDGSKVFLHSMYQGLDLEGEGRVYAYSKSNPKEVAVATGSGHLSRDYDGKVYIAECGATGDDYEKDSPALQTAFDIIRNNDGGILSMGENCTYLIEGDIKANCTKLDWQFNKSKIITGITTIAWHPYKHGLGNYEDINITEAVWIGNVRKRASDGYGGIIHMDFIQCDNISVTDCTYIEAINGGHYLDLMSCRNTTFERNTVLGAHPVRNSARVFAEAVQVGPKGSVQSAGAPVDPSVVEFFRDGIDTIEVYFRHNVFKPYTNPTTGVTSYPPRPIGDHVLTASSEVYVQNNYIEDVVVLEEGSSYRNCILSMSGIHNLHVNDNIIISNNGNFNIVKFTTWNELAIRGDTKTLPSFSFSGNIVKVSNLTKTTTARYARPIDFGFIEYGDETIPKGIGFKANFSKNTINYDATSAEAGIVNTIDIMYFTAGLKNVNINANNNTFDTIGSVRSHIVTHNSLGRIGGRFEYCGNTFKGHVSGRTLDHKHSGNVANGEGSEVIAENNTFIKQWLGVNLDTTGLLLYKNNKHIGFEAVSPSGEAGSGNTILLNKGYPIVAQGNILINETRLTPVKIVSSTVVRPESEFLIKNNV